MSEPGFNDTAAAGYDRTFARITTHFMPYLLRDARLAPGQIVLDIATGTGLAAEAALAVVGPTGRVIAADLSPAMLEQARARLGEAANASFAVEDGQALSFPEASFDAVLCSFGLMFFPDPARGLAEFHRVLRPGGRAVVSVNTVPERSFSTRISFAAGRRVPALTDTTDRVFSLGDEAHLHALFAQPAFGRSSSRSRPTGSACPHSTCISRPMKRAPAISDSCSCRCPQRCARSCKRTCGADGRPDRLPSCDSTGKCAAQGDTCPGSSPTRTAPADLIGSSAFRCASSFLPSCEWRGLRRDRKCWTSRPAPASPPKRR